jgi:hypothetical protein
LLTHAVLWITLGLDDQLASCEQNKAIVSSVPYNPNNRDAIRDAQKAKIANEVENAIKVRIHRLDLRTSDDPPSSDICDHPVFRALSSR